MLHRICRNSALAAAGCSLVRQTFWICGGDHGNVVLALEIVVAVGEMDRCVPCVHVAEEVGGVGLITCVWSWVGHSARHASRERACRVFPEASSHGCGGR